MFFFFFNSIISPTYARCPIPKLQMLNFRDVSLYKLTLWTDSFQWMFRAMLLHIFLDVFFFFRFCCCCRPCCCCCCCISFFICDGCTFSDLHSGVRRSLSNPFTVAIKHGPQCSIMTKSTSIKAGQMKWGRFYAAKTFLNWLQQRLFPIKKMTNPMTSSGECSIIYEPIIINHSGEDYRYFFLRLY